MQFESSSTPDKEVTSLNDCPYTYKGPTLMTKLEAFPLHIGQSIMSVL